MNIKSFLSLIVAAFVSFSVVAQVGIGTTNPDSSAALDIQHSTKGFLMPRLSLTARDAISKPAEGLQIYNTTNNRPEIYSQGRWQAVNYSNQYYYNESSNDLEGLVQTDSLNNSCLSFDDNNYVTIDAFDLDSITGDAYYLVSYSQRQFFFGYELRCVDAQYPAALIKLDSNRNLIWKKEIQGFSGSVTAKLNYLSSGHLILGFTGSNTIIEGQAFNNGTGSYIIAFSEGGGYLYHKFIANATITFLGKNRNNVIGYIYTTGFGNFTQTFAEMISPGISSFTNAWASFKLTSNSLSTFTVNPFENSMYIYTGTALKKLSSQGEQTVVSLGSTTGTISSYNDGIVVTNSNIQLTTAPLTTLTFNGITYSGLLHITISRSSNQILNIQNLNFATSTGISITNTLIVGNTIIEFFQIAFGIGSTSQTQIRMCIYNSEGGILSNNSSPSLNSTVIKSVRSFRNRAVFAGYYGSEDVGKGFLRFNFPFTSGNRSNYFLFSLVIP